MKISLTICLILGLCLNLQSQTKSTNVNELSGTWCIDTMYIDVEMTEQMLEVYTERFCEIKKTTQFVFKEDGEYLKVSKDAPRNGRWEVTENGELLTLKFEGNGEETRLRVNYLDKDHVVFYPQGKNEKTEKIKLIRQH